MAAGGAARAEAEVDPEVVAGLASADLDVRRDAAERLAEEGGAGLDLLLARIQAAPPAERPLYLVALAAAGPSGRVLEVLSDALRDSDARVRSAAAEAAAGFEAPAAALRDALRVSLSDPSPDVRLFAAEAVTGLPDAGNVRPLLPLLADPLPDVRAAAAEALTAHGRFAAEAHEALRVRLRQDEAPEVRAHAARALGRLGSTAPPILEALATASQEPQSSVRREAREALGLLGPGAAAALPALRAGLADREDEAARAAAAWALGRLGPKAQPAVPELVQAALNDHALVADEAILALARIGDVPAIGEVCANYYGRGPMLEALALRDRPLAEPPEPVLAALADTAPDRRYAAMRVLAPMAHPAALATFIARLGDSDGRSRVLAAQALGRYGASAERAIPALVGLLDDAAGGVAEAAAAALIAIGPASLPAVKPILEGRHSRARPWAALVVGALGGVGAEAALRRARGAEGDALRVAASAALFALNPKDLDALDGIVGALTGPSGDARRQAALAVARLGPAKAAPALDALLGALDGPEVVARLQVVRALALFEDPHATRGLRRALGDRDEQVRMAAAEALGRRKADAAEAVRALALLLPDPDTRAGLVAARVLGRLGPAARDAIPALIAIDDRDRERLVAAQDALRAIAGEPVLPAPGLQTEPGVAAPPGAPGQ
ncbi:MAG: HEAT repeat domain-containing protein [Myxococcales bacterium]|nr:HEAT repeat domain-containing protein [Myxococcales bacterium]